MAFAGCVTPPVETPAPEVASTEDVVRPDRAQRPPPEQFDERWYTVRPRTAEGVYPNLPADWEAMPNPRFAVPEDRPLEGLRICVDAGHGGQVWGSAHGYTGGTRGRVTGLPESSANLRTAFFLWDLLTQAGAEVTMTRMGPDRMAEPTSAAPGSPEWVENRHRELISRAEIADAAGCDYFITIHHNAGAPTNYVSCYYYDTRQWDKEYNEDPPYTNRYPDEELNRERYQLAMEIQSAMSRRQNLRVIHPAIEWSNMYYGNGVPSHDITVLRESKLAGVLVEVSFMTDEEEDLRLNDPARAKQAAVGVFEGILAHFRYRPMVRWSERPLAGPPG
jgi:N-acetylmuramoyl-L-alanine amidase